jgi:hypothetical protein
VRFAKKTAIYKFLIISKLLLPGVKYLKVFDVFRSTAEVFAR